MIICPLSFIRSTNNSIVLHNNAYNLGYRNLFFYKAKYPEKSSQYTFNNTVDVCFSGLDTDTYCFILTNSNTGDKVIQQYMLGWEDTSTTLKQIEDYIKNPYDEDLLSTCIKSNKKMLYEYESLTESYVKKYQSIEEPSESEEKCFYQIIYACERMENILAFTQNVYLDDASITYGTIPIINSGSNVTSIDIFRPLSTQNSFYKKISCNMYESVELTLPENDYYHIELCHNNEILARLVYYRFSDKIAQWLYEQEIEVEENIDQTIIDDLLLKQSNIEFTTEEKKWLIEEKNLVNKNWLVRPPRIVGTHPNKSNVLRVFVQDYLFLKAFNKKFYLCASDADIFTEMVCYPWTVITSNIVEFDTKITTNDIVFFIKDAQGNTISDYTRYNSNSESYRAKKYELDRLEYGDSLQKWINLAIEDTSIKEHFKSDITNAVQNLTSLGIDIFESLFTVITSSHSYVSIRNKLLLALANHWFDYFDILDTFLPSGKTITYYSSTDKLMFGPGESVYVATIFTWNMNDEKIKKEYITGSVDEAMSIYTNKTDYMLIYLTEPNTYKKSGYVFISNVTAEKCLLSNKFKIEVNTVDN